MATIRFPQTQIYDKEAKAVNFQAHLDKDTISCSLSLDALQDHFLGDIFKPLQAFIVIDRQLSILRNGLLCYNVLNLMDRS